VQKVQQVSLLQELLRALLLLAWGQEWALRVQQVLQQREQP
jgi:hypothetical protein